MMNSKIKNLLILNYYKKLIIFKILIFDSFLLEFICEDALSNSIKTFCF